jgi:CDP-diacylglycerol--glycerol-3-phosphate 3-phosphatidyltransferase
VTFANTLTASRLVTVPLMLLSAWLHRPGWFAVLFGYALVSDLVDGSIARALGQATPFGARLDSICDAAVYLTAPLAALMLYPVLREREWITVAAVFVAYVVPIGIGFIKYRRLTAYHTLAARAAAILLGIAALLFVTLGITWPLRAGAAVLLLSAIEEIAMTLILPEWRANVWSVVHALRQRTPASVTKV